MANNVQSYGFIDLASLFSQRVASVNGGAKQVYDAVRLSAEIQTGAVNEMLDALAERTTEYKTRYTLPASGSLQPIGPDGNPIPVQPSGYYDVAYPIHHAGVAWNKGRVAAQKMTVEEADRLTFMAQYQDGDWVKRHALAAMFQNVAYTWVDPEKGSLTVEVLANGDAVEYPKVDGSKATDSHYLFQAAAISDAANPYTAIRAELKEHPSNIGDIVCYIASNLTTTTTGLASFVPVKDDALVLGSAATSIDEGALAAIQRARMGGTILGRTDECWIVELPMLPAGYIVSVCLDSGKVLAMREYDVPALQGFFIDPKTKMEDALYDMTLLRMCGFGVQNRIAATVTLIGAGAYAVPTGYAAPLSA